MVFPEALITRDTEKQHRKTAILTDSDWCKSIVQQQNKSNTDRNGGQSNKHSNWRDLTGSAEQWKGSIIPTQTLQNDTSLSFGSAPADRLIDCLPPASLLYRCTVNGQKEGSYCQNHLNVLGDCSRAAKTILSISLRYRSFKYIRCRVLTGDHVCYCLLFSVKHTTLFVLSFGIIRS